MKKRSSKSYKHMQRNQHLDSTDFGTEENEFLTDQHEGKNPHFLIAKKSLGQNFLKNTTIIKRIADAGNIQPGDIIIEIGPGTGELTAGILDNIEAIADAQGTKSNNMAMIKPFLIAIEKDSRAIPILKERFAAQIEKGYLYVLEGDYLEMEPEKVIQEVIMASNKAESKNQDSKEGKNSHDFTYKIIANIPYYITGAIIRKSLEERLKPEKLIFLVQKEVAERIITRDGKESILSNSVKAYGTPSILCTVSKGNFVPAPKVDSAVIVIDHISSHNFDSHHITEKAFFDVIHAGFGHKRKKTLSNLTEIGLSKLEIESIFDDLTLDHNIRSEEIPLETWLKITHAIVSSSATRK